MSLTLLSESGYFEVGEQRHYGKRSPKTPKRQYRFVLDVKSCEELATCRGRQVEALHQLFTDLANFLVVKMGEELAIDRGDIDRSSSRTLHGVLREIGREEL